ncbi:hypothetical protein CH333_05880 [candidate division WOR-3 bacterium JGI_Cruoil_03_44_89]|uniref:ROK family protein n=1 Tax=candidate division WOR-3 bacterium JGI_Cruoil_03_44_89 TaxID=1973748 RepID=A0A235BT58_UNCW3|nr:MAG: hypothetical protein CH333_05880 [candidate division WOR-3 bacterium JGI_Cruoil_03_44_89]
MIPITCIDVGGTFIKAGNVADGEISDERKIDTGNPGTLTRTLSQLILELGGRAAGIGITGLVDGNGRISSSPNLPEIKSLPLKEILERELNIPVLGDKVKDIVQLQSWEHRSVS